MIGFFVKNKESKYYSSNQFNFVLKIVQTHYKIFKMKEKNNLLSLVFLNVSTIDRALDLLKKIYKPEQIKLYKNKFL